MSLQASFTVFHNHVLSSKYCLRVVVGATDVVVTAEEQFVPIYPDAHAHEYDVPETEHVPAFSQGLGKHGSSERKHALYITKVNTFDLRFNTKTFRAL